LTPIGSPDLNGAEEVSGDRLVNISSGNFVGDDISVEDPVDSWLLSDPVVEPQVSRSNSKALKQTDWATLKLLKDAAEDKRRSETVGDRVAARAAPLTDGITDEARVTPMMDSALSGRENEQAAFPADAAKLRDNAVGDRLAPFASVSRSTIGGTEIKDFSGSVGDDEQDFTARLVD
jgi:hypothetical protein